MNEANNSFRDDMHFGSRAHELFAKEVADMLGNNSTNGQVLNQSVTNTSEWR